MRARLPAMLFAVAATLATACGPDCAVEPAAIAPRAGLDPEADYLTAQRRAAETADPQARERWAQAQAGYARFKTVRFAEIAASPAFTAHPEATADWSADEWLGQDTWFHWTGGDEHTWRDLAQRSKGRLDLLRLIDNRQLPRAERFARFGLINDPGTSGPAEGADGGCAPDAFGLCLDRIDDPGVSPETAAVLGRPSGIMGLRVFDNPDYRPGAWDPENPITPPAGCVPGRRSGDDPAATARESRADCYQPPYLVGITCGFCHISFDPETPPADPRAPGWENLVGAVGNVYLQEGPLFAWMLDFGDDAFYTEYLMAQPAGTSDTSRIATDDLDNPGAINSLFELGARLAEAEVQELPSGHRAAVPNVLKDGADSAGVPLAALRVYVNIGMLGNYWLNRHDAYLLLGGEPTAQEPFFVDRAIATPGYDGTYWWDHTQARMADLRAFFTAGRAPKLARAPGGGDYLAADAATLERGRTVFADHCAGCHSSKRPGFERREDPASWRAAMREEVAKDDFLAGNFLSDDRRHPATAVGVNLTRSMATNALEGHVWQDFSSLTYKNLPPLGALELAHPFTSGESVDFCAPAGGRGYYRTTSLVGLWATAPFFHNNSVGRHVHDPSVAGRMRAFEDAAEQLLWPERRTGPDGTPGPYVKRTSDQVTWLPLPGDVLVPVPPEYPIKMLGNLPLHRLLDAMPARLRSALAGEKTAVDRERKERIARRVLGSPTLSKILRRLLLDMNAAPDFVENKGHEAIVAEIASDADKRALIEFMKTF